MPRQKLPGENVLRTLYWEEGLSLADIGERYGVTRAAVMLAFGKHKIPCRDKSAARLLALQRGKFPDHKYHEFNRKMFHGWSSGMAYMLGMVLADGHVNKAGLFFGFGNKSFDIACNICKLMESNRRPEWEDNNGFPGWRLRYCSYEMALRLKELGVPWGKKAKIIKVPLVPLGLLRHFIRGFWDGDGSAGGNLVRFHSSSLMFLEQTRDALGKLGVDVERGKIHKKKARLYTFPQGTQSIVAGAGTLLYCAKSVREQIYHLFYDNVEQYQYSSVQRERFRTSMWWLEDW
jgi:hypothetical protein